MVSTSLPTGSFLRRVTLFRRQMRKHLGRDPLAPIAILLLGVVILMAIFGPSLAPHNPLKPSSAMFSPPLPGHPFGTDQLGRDVLARVLSAFRLDLSIAVTAVAGASIIGVTIGSVSGFMGRRFDDVFMRVIDVIQSFPMLVLAMTLAAFLGSGMNNLILITTIVNIPVFARLSRSDILSKKQMEYIDAARCSGCSAPRILARHLVPNIIGPVIVQSTLSLAWAMLNAAALSFLGIGVNPPTPELGVMVAEGGAYLSRGAWWMSVFPGLGLVIAVFAFNLIGDTLQDRLDPRREAA